MGKEQITVGVVGAGYASQLHCNGYKKVHGVSVRLKSICDMDLQRAKQMASNNGIEEIYSDFRYMLDDQEIDVIDICTPPNVHAKMIEDAVSAGKHVICEKPLTGYFGQEDDPRPIGEKVPKKKMYECVLSDIQSLEKILSNSKSLFMYAENYVYAPTVQKAAEIIHNKKSKVLFMKGEESLAGSSSPVAGKWEKTGGGSLIRVGTHPLSGILWLKQEEAKARGEEIRVEKVTCDVGKATAILGEDKGHIRANPEDVEDVATLTLTFSDGTKALIIASDTVLGGTINYIEVYAHDAAMLCRLTPPGCMDTYFLDERGLEAVNIAEMLPSVVGWQHAFVVDEILRGYTAELQDFMDCALTGRKPMSDFKLAAETIRIIYAAYWSAEEGRTITL